MITDLGSEFMHLLRAVVREEVERVLRSSRSSEPVAQADSPLGRRRHIAAARRRIRESTGGAWKIGRKYYLDPEALREELQLLGSPSRKREESASLDDQLGIIDHSLD